MRRNWIRIQLVAPRPRVMPAGAGPIDSRRRELESRSNEIAGLAAMTRIRQPIPAGERLAARWAASAPAGTRQDQPGETIPGQAAPWVSRRECDQGGRPRERWMLVLEELHQLLLLSRRVAVAQIGKRLEEVAVEEQIGEEIRLGRSAPGAEPAHCEPEQR